MSLSYTNFPVYIGAANGTAIDTDEDYLTATQVNVKYNTAPSPKRTLGSTVATGDQFKFGQPLQADISFTSYIATETTEVGEGTCYTFTKENNTSDFFPIQIGGNLFKSCYVKDYSVSVFPYQPVTVSANFTSLDPPTGSGVASTAASSYESAPAKMSPDGIVYGHTCLVNNMTDVVGSVQSQINFQRTYNRSPIYTLGSINATSMLLDGVESQMSITSTGVNNLIDFSGNNVANDVSVSLLGNGGQENNELASIKIDAGARVISQDYAMAGGDTLIGSVTLREVSL